MPRVIKECLGLFGSPLVGLQLLGMLLREGLERFGPLIAFGLTEWSCLSLLGLHPTLALIWTGLSTAGLFVMPWYRSYLDSL